MTLRRIACITSICIIMMMLTSCGGGDDHHLNASQLAELEAALVQVENKEQKDQAALASAIASGADPATIALLRSAVWADETEKNVIFVTFDEDNDNLSLGDGNAGNHVNFVVIPNGP